MATRKPLPERQGDHTLSQFDTPSPQSSPDDYNLKAGSMEDPSLEKQQGEPQNDRLTFVRFMVLVAMSFLWVASQIPLYLYGGIIPIIMASIGGADRYEWVVLGNLLPLGAVTPFVGALSDLFGRRWLALAAGVLLVVGNVVCATANIMNVFIGGQVIIGVGAGIAELTSLAVAGEIAPTARRGLYVGAIIMTIIPFCPSVLYAQEISAAASWRYLGLICGGWSFIGLVITAIFFWPPPRSNSTGLSRMQILKRIDITGGILSTAGVTLFLAGLTWAGGQYQWGSPHVLVPLILGGCLVIAFIIWEKWIVRYPMFPRALNKNPRILGVILTITGVSGANFFAVLLFWPSQYYFMYAENNPLSAGLGSLPVGFGIIGGSIIVSVLISVLKGKVRTVMVISCIIMTAGNGGMAGATLTNLDALYVPVCLACVGVGAVIIPNQIIATIVCPGELIATITSCTIAVRVIGGAVGYAVYYNVLKQRYSSAAQEFIVPAAYKLGVTDPTELFKISSLISANLKSDLLGLPHITSQEQVNVLLQAGREAFAQAYPPVYYSSIAFGSVATIAAFFLPDLSPFMTGDVAVHY
ncbi:MAG: hypothetical protein M1828_004692 [Chrysothrix sp. TS-e1954]|nr:MAG: hypothetical protein M1828_004692 [Chrysothrix sp. TS-e1954]